MLRTTDRSKVNELNFTMITHDCCSRSSSQSMTNAIVIIAANLRNERESCESQVTDEYGANDTGMKAEGLAPGRI